MRVENNITLKNRASLVFFWGFNFFQNVLKKNFWASSMVGCDFEWGEVYIIAEPR